MSRAQTSEDRHGAAALALLEDLPIEPICVRVATAVKLTGIPRSTLYELIGSGELETAKIGRSTFILYASLKRLFEKH
jgi:excisionase family DNA binding protein